MDHQSSKGLQQFKNNVGIKFQLYNSLFTSLPFHRIEKTGILLSLLLNYCEEGYKKKKSPEEIIEEFFQKAYIFYKRRRQARPPVPVYTICRAAGGVVRCAGRCRFQGSE